MTERNELCRFNHTFAVVSYFLSCQLTPLSWLQPEAFDGVV